MKTVDVIMATRGGDKPLGAIQSLRHLPFPIRLQVIVGKGFQEAINEGLKRSSGDVLLVDDDIELLPETFADFQKHYPSADVFGFKLLFRSGTIQHAGGFVQNGGLGHLGYGQRDAGQLDLLLDVCHVTSALAYYKRAVIKEIGELSAAFTPSSSLSDVDYSFRILKAGFRIRYLPYPAIHDEQPKTDPAVLQGIQDNLVLLRRLHFDDPDFSELIESYPREVSG